MPGRISSVLLVQLDQFVAGARAVAVLLRLLDVRIIDVLLQPVAAALGSCHWKPGEAGSDLRGEPRSGAIICAPISLSSSAGSNRPGYAS